jgi:HEAT repeat protein
MCAEETGELRFSRAPIEFVIEVAVGGTAQAELQDRVRAVAALVRRDPKLAVEPLARILGRTREHPDLRIAAATLLRQTEPEQAERVLLRNLGTEEADVRYRVIKSLGHIGGLPALRRLDQLPAPAGEAEAKQLAFAKALIAYRDGLDRDDIPFVEGVRRQPGEPDQLLELSLTRVLSPDRIAEVIDQLGRDTFGIQLARDLAFDIDVGRAHWTLLLNRDPATKGLLEALGERRWLLGVLALRAPATGTHSVQYVALTKPVGAKTQILIVRNDGEVVYSGEAELSAEGLGFQVSDVKRRGTAPTRVEGRLTGRGFQLTVALPFRMRKDKRRAQTQSARSLEEMRRGLERSS